MFLLHFYIIQILEMVRYFALQKRGKQSEFMSN